MKPAAAPTHKVTRAADLRVPRSLDQAAAGRYAAAGIAARGRARGRHVSPSRATAAYLPTAHLAPLDRSRAGFRRRRRAIRRHALSLGRQEQPRHRLLRPGADRADSRGIACPRDSDMQQAGSAARWNRTSEASLQRGDLMFWKGHVAIVRDAQHHGARQRASHGDRDRADRAEAIARIKASRQRGHRDQAALSGRSGRHRPVPRRLQPERRREQRARVIASSGSRRARRPGLPRPPCRRASRSDGSASEATTRRSCEMNM